MPTLTERLHQLAAAYEAKAAALRLAAQELNGHARAHAALTLPAKLAQAISRTRQQQVRPTTIRDINAQRERSQALLDDLEAHGPYPWEKLGRRAAPLMRTGHILKTKDGLYMRSKKPYDLVKPGTGGTRGRPAGSSRAALDARIAAIKRPETPDRSFPRLKSRSLADVEAFEARVQAYWAEH